MSRSSPVYSIDYLTLISVPAISEITVKASVTSINGVKGGVYAFQDAKDTIETVKFEPKSSLASISPCCFLNCKKLSLVDFSSCTKILSIGDEAFKSCTSLKTLQLPETIVSIGSEVFYESGLTSLHIPSLVAEYGVYNCFNCFSLVEFTIDPNAPMKKLTNHQFTSTSLISLKLTKAIKEFSGDNFEHVTTITTLECDTSNPYIEAEYNVFYYKSDKTIIYAAPTKTGTYQMRGDVQYIGLCAFHSSAISGINISPKVKIIGACAFFACRNLLSIDIPTNVEGIFTYAFGACSKLETVTFHEGLQTIESSAFSGCGKIQSVTIPSTITSYGGKAFPRTVEFIITPGADLSVSEGKEFIMNGAKTRLIECLSYESVLNLPNTIQVIVGYAFYELQTITKLNISPETPLTDIEVYAFSFSSISEIKLPESLQNIRQRAFQNCNNLKKIHFGRDFTLLDEGSFMNCISLEEITATSSNQLIIMRKNVFLECTKLHTASLAGRVRDLGDDALFNCVSLQSFEFGNGINTIGIRAFQNTGLTSVKFATSGIVNLGSIPTRCFYQCTNLTTINIPEGVKTIMDEAFAFTNITNIVLPKSVMEVKGFSFKECRSLETFTIPTDSELNKIGFGVFLNCPSFRTIENNSTNFQLSNDALFNKEMTELYILPPMSSCKFFSFPTQLKTVCAFALQGCKNVQVVFVPSSVTEIMQSAFRDCTNLRSINLPKECVSIGSDAFKCCDKMQCGIPIENEDSEFRESLVNSAGLLKTAIEDCSLMCQSFERKFLNYSLSVFFINIILLLN